MSFQIAASPPWIAVPLFFIATPYIVHKSLQFKWVTYPMFLSLSIPILFIQALFFSCSDPKVNLMIGSTACVQTLKLFEVATLDRSITQSWTLYEMFEYNLTARLRRLHSSKQSTTPVNKPFDHIVLIINAFVHYILYCATYAYCIKYPYTYDKLFLWPLDWTPTNVKDHLVLPVMLYTIMNISMPWRIPFHIAWNDPIQYNFKNPWASTSLHDFWSRRWNFKIRDSIHRAVFIPVLHTLSNQSPSKKASKPPNHKRYTLTQLRIASFASFLASALFHEFLAIFIAPGEPIGHQFLFFLLNAALLTVQMEFQRATGYGKTWGTGSFWKILGWVMTMTCLLTLSPLFVAPYLRTGAFLHTPAFEPIVALFKEVL